MINFKAYQESINFKTDSDFHQHVYFTAKYSTMESEEQNVIIPFQIYSAEKSGGEICT